MITDFSNIVIVNLTNQEIKYYPKTYTDIVTSIPVGKANIKLLLARCTTILSSGHARAQMNRDIDTARVGNKNILLSYTSVGTIDALPPEKDNTIYIVSQMCFNAIHHVRKDVYMIDKPVRTVEGKVIACQGFSRCVYDTHIAELQPVIRYMEKKLSELSAGNEFDKVHDLVIRLNKYIEK